MFSSLFPFFLLRPTRLDRFQRGSASVDLVHDFLHRRCPHERPGMFVPGPQELPDRRLQFRHADKGRPTHGLLRQFTKPTLHLIEPTRTGGNEVQDKSRMLGQPRPHPGMFMGAVVVQYQMEF